MLRWEMMAHNEASLVLADDHPVVLKGLAHLLETVPGIRIFAACRTGSEALDAIRDRQPTLAILDINMPDMSGLDVARSVAQQGLPTQVILLTAAATYRQEEEARLAGATLIFKDAAPDELLGLVAAKLALPGTKGSKLETTPSTASFEPTQREWQIAELVSDGLSNKEIARTLKLSEATVKAHLHNIFSKTGLTSRTALAALTFKRRIRQ